MAEKFQTHELDEAVRWAGAKKHIHHVLDEVSECLCNLILGRKLFVLSEYSFSNVLLLFLEVCLSFCI